jgi:hypothetical protein
MGKKESVIVGWREVASGVCIGLLLGFFLGLLAMAYFFEGFINSIQVENMNVGIDEQKLVEQVWLRMGPEIARCNGGVANDVRQAGAGG